MNFGMNSIILALQFFAFASRAETLNEFIDKVRISNPSLESLRAQAESEKFRANAAGYWEDPFFGVGPDDVPTNDNKAGMLRYQLSQTIPFPGRLGARKEAAINQAAGIEAQARTTERELVITAAQLYARAYFAEKSVLANREQRRLLSDVVGSTRARYKTGAGDHHELVLARVEQATLDAEHLRLLREVTVLKTKMNELKSAPPDAAIELSDVSFVGEMPETFEEALEHQPEIRGVQANFDLSQAELRTAKLSYFPDLVLQAMYMQPRNSGMETDMGMDAEAGASEPAQWGAMVGISIPIFFFGKQANLKSAAQANRDAAIAQKRALENRLKSEWVEATAQVKTAEDLLKLYKSEVVPNTELAARTARTAYVARRLPLTQFLEVLRVQKTQALELVASELDVALAKLRKKYLLSTGTNFRLSPMRPTLFGGGGMSGMSAGSEAVNMGSGMRTPVIQKRRQSQEPSAGGMEGM